MNTIRFKRPKKFILCIDRFDTLGKRVWAVCVNGGWTMHKKVDVRVPTTTVFKGLKARQPIAYLTGYCKSIQLTKLDTLVIQQ